MKTTPPRDQATSTSAAEADYRSRLVAHWDRIAARGPRRRGGAAAYRERLRTVFGFLVPPGQRVLEIGSGGGDLLAALSPSVGVGVDPSPAMIERARQRHRDQQFVQSAAEDLDLAGAGITTTMFDFVILSDVLNEMWDVQRALERVAPYCGPQTRIIVNTYSRLWEWPLRMASRLGLANLGYGANWLQSSDVTNLLYLSNFEVVRVWQEFVFPFRIPVVGTWLNRVLPKVSPFRWFALANFVMARPAPRPMAGPAPLVSVIVAARNEQGNIKDIFARTPELGGGTELVFVEGHSHDDTYAEIQRQIAANPGRRARVFQQTGKGKGDAVRLGFEKAAGKVLMILDADLTVPPEDLPRFYEALVSGKGEFINGTRLVYPMEDRAMRFANLIGNKFFSLAFSWLLGQPLKDTLCGTKVLSKADYELIAANRAYFGEFDPFGDFDLLFGAARLSRKIVDLPVRYRERTYGETNISRWRHGWLLLQMTVFALTRIKFV